MEAFAQASVLRIPAFPARSLAIAPPCQVGAEFLKLFQNLNGRRALVILFAIKSIYFMINRAIRRFQTQSRFPCFFHDGE